METKTYDGPSDTSPTGFSSGPSISSYDNRKIRKFKIFHEGYHSFGKGLRMLDEEHNSRGKEFKKSKKFRPVKFNRNNFKPIMNRKIIGR